MINAIKKQLSDSKQTEISSENILRFFKSCENFSIKLDKIENVRVSFFEQKLNQEYYLTNEFINNNFSNKIINKVYSILLAIYSHYDIDHMLKMIITK